jgi:HK97 family phage prohead protease
MEKRKREGKQHWVVAATELRIQDNDAGGKTLVGYAAVFDRWSEDLGFFREIIRAGAFRKTLSDGADVRALFNHDPNFVLGRTKSGTLRLEEDERGLRIEGDLPDTQMVRDLVISPIERGDIDQMSFGFRSVKDEWNEDYTERELLEVQLFDVSAVTFPAYPQTEVGVRVIGEQWDAAEVRSAAMAERREAEPNEEEREHEQDDEPQQEPHSEDLVELDRRLEAIEIEL